MKTRCSSLDRQLSCPGYKLNPLIIMPESEYAAAGTASHAEAERRCLAEELDPKYEFNKYVEFYVNARKKGAEIILEVYKENEYLTGTADMVAFVKNSTVMYINDLKTGFKTVYPDCAQLKGYALLNLRLETETIFCSIYQDGQFRIHEYTRQEILDFEAEIKSSMLKKELKLGSHCQFCEMSCPLQQAALENALGFPASLTTIAENKDPIAKWIKKGHDAVLGAEEAPDGYEFIVKETKRRSIDIKNAPAVFMKQAPITLKDAQEYIKQGIISKEQLDANTITRTTKVKKMVRVETYENIIL